MHADAAQMAICSDNDNDDHGDILDGAERRFWCVFQSARPHFPENPASLLSLLFDAAGRSPYTAVHLHVVFGIQRDYSGGHVALRDDDYHINILGCPHDDDSCSTNSWSVQCLERDTGSLFSGRVISS